MQTCFKLISRQTKYAASINYYGKILLLKHNSLSSIQNLTLVSRVDQKKVWNVKDLIQLIQEEKPFCLRLPSNIFDTIDFQNISNKEASILLNCCGDSVVGSSREARNKVCQDIYKNLLKHNKLDINIYNIYIKKCTENGIMVNGKEFLANLTCDPSHCTYKILLENVCVQGNIEEAYILLEIMKNKSVSVDEEVFNSLVLAHSIRGGLEGADTVLKTMKTAQIPETINTKLSVLKGIIRRGNDDEFKKFLLKYPLNLGESEFLVVLKELGLNGNLSWLQEIKNFKGFLTFSRDFMTCLEAVCVNLVHMDKSEAALTIFEEFKQPSPDDNYGFFILKEMLHSNVEMERIVSLAKYLRNKGLNKYIFENLTDTALRCGYIEASWNLLENLPELKPHYFWPLLVHAHDTEGEGGVFSTLNKIISMNVTLDSETLESYILPFCNLDDTDFLVQKLKKLGSTVKNVMNPILVVLLHNKQIKSAAALCNSYDVQISGEGLLKLLSSSWYTSKDTKSAVLLLQKYCESNAANCDFVGDFLVDALTCCVHDDDFKHYIKLLEMVNDKKLKISPPTTDILNDTLPSKCEKKLCEKIQEKIDVLLDFRPKLEPPLIPHPSNMNVDELECHLLELQAKNMNPRGLFRKLIQLHSNLGNFQRAEELRSQFISAGYVESVGMKSSIMHSYVKKGILEPALTIYQEIKNANPNFILDDFKVIDLAALLIKGNKFEKAMEIITAETNLNKKVVGGQSILRNCLELLHSFDNEKEQMLMFSFLTDNGYCKPTNVILGPLVRIHLKRGDLEMAAGTYIDLADKFNLTPLQLELIRTIAKTGNENLLQKVLDCTERVHGSIRTREVLVAALAENGQEKPLKKILANNTLPIKKELKNRCERWIKEGKVKPLQTLANCCQRLRQEAFDVNFVYDCILKIYKTNNDCNSALQFYNSLLKNDVPTNDDIETQLRQLLANNNVPVPQNLKVVNN